MMRNNAISSMQSIILLPRGSFFYHFSLDFYFFIIIGIVFIGYDAIRRLFTPQCIFIGLINGQAADNVITTFAIGNYALLSA